jgi:glutaredoxin
MTETIVWSKDNCPYCITAKSLLASKGIRYEERKIGDGWTREQLLESLPAIPKTLTVPQIWLHGEYIGGCDQLEAYMESHEMWRND